MLSDWDVRENGIWFSCVNKFEEILLTPERFILMQFTGLKDCKGCEIYEGDIVRYCGSMQVRTAGECDYPIRKIHWRDDLASFGWGYGLGINKQYVSDDWEIIGDIYSNPELIGGQIE